MGDQVVGGDQDAPVLVPEDRVGGTVSWSVEDLQRAISEGQQLLVLQRFCHLCSRAPTPEASRNALQRPRHLLGDAVAQHQLDREAVLSLGVLAEVGQALGSYA